MGSRKDPEKFTLGDSLRQYIKEKLHEKPMSSKDYTVFMHLFGWTIYTVPELKNYLEHCRKIDFSISTKGSKDQLVEKLKSFIQEHHKPIAAASKSGNKKRSQSRAASASVSSTSRQALPSDTCAASKDAKWAYNTYCEYAALCNRLVSVSMDNSKYYHEVFFDTEVEESKDPPPLLPRKQQHGRTLRGVMTCSKRSYLKSDSSTDNMDSDEEDSDDMDSEEEEAELDYSSFITTIPPAVPPPTALQAPRSAQPPAKKMNKSLKSSKHNIPSGVKPAQPNNIIFGHPSGSIASTAMPLKQTGIYQELKAAGFTDEQAAAGIQATGGPTVADFDSAMLWIVTSLEEKDRNERNEEEDDIEDADMQATILMSEGEREVIESRKRKREEDLLHDCQCDIETAVEFQNSFILFGFPNYIPHRAGVASTSTCGTSSRTIKELLKQFKEHSARCQKQSSRDKNCTCPKQLSALKASLTALLVLESKAHRWFGKSSMAYMYYLLGKFDSDCWNNSLHFGLLQDAPRSSSHFNLDIMQLQGIIDSEVDKLQSALFSIPETDCGIPGPPKVFLESSKTLGIEFRVKDGPDLEEDGLEIIE